MHLVNGSISPLQKHMNKIIRSIKYCLCLLIAKQFRVIPRRANKSLLFHFLHFFFNFFKLLKLFNFLKDFKEVKEFLHYSTSTHFPSLFAATPASYIASHENAGK